MSNAAALTTTAAARHGPAWLAPRSSRPRGPFSSSAATPERRSSTISEVSDVPPATVYRLFSTKLGILKALLDVSIAGDDQAVALADRPHIRALVADEDPVNQLAGLAGLVCGIMSRAEPLHRILVSAAASDPDAAALLAELTRQRQHGHAQIARSLARARVLRPKLRERDADDIVHALTSPEVSGCSSVDRGWPPARYEQWLKDILIEQLLAPPRPEPGAQAPDSSFDGTPGGPAVITRYAPPAPALVRVSWPGEAPVRCPGGGASPGRS